MATIPNPTHLANITLELGIADPRLSHPTINVKQVVMTKSVEETGEAWVPRQTASNANFNWGH